MMTNRWIAASICAALFAVPALGKSKKGPLASVPPPQAPPERTTANGSLYSDDAPGGSLIGDFKPHLVGDLVFVDVLESSAASATSSASRQRQTDGVQAVLTGSAAIPVPGMAYGTAAAAELAGRKYAGKGSTDRKSSLRARIAARVVEVLPNGDLRIAASKVVKINKEDEKLVVSGVVRRRDISAADNSVATTAIGDLTVELNGKGVASADNAPGWLFRILDKIAPF